MVQRSPHLSSGNSDLIDLRSMASTYMGQDGLSPSEQENIEDWLRDVEAAKTKSWTSSKRIFWISFGLNGVLLAAVIVFVCLFALSGESTSSVVSTCASIYDHFKHCACSEYETIEDTSTPKYANQSGFEPFYPQPIDRQLSCRPLSEADDLFLNTECDVGDLESCLISAEKDWIVIQRRTIFDVGFERSFSDYEDGFGTSGDFWIGLRYLHELTNNGSTWVMRTTFESWSGHFVWVEYRGFSVGSKSANYRLYTGYQIGGSFDDGDRGWEYHDGQQFTTYDRDNDQDSTVNCAIFGKGGWWYSNTHCYSINLNGRETYGSVSDDIENWGEMLYHGVEGGWMAVKKSLIRIKTI